MQRSVWSALCERALDYLESGAAQRLHMREELMRRIGSAKDPTQDPSSPGAIQETDAGLTIRLGEMEQVTVPLVQSVVQDLAATYAADDLERLWSAPGQEPDPTVAATMSWYHKRGGLAPSLIEVDELVALLRLGFLCVRWAPGLGHITYDIMPPHWVYVLPHPQWPLDHRLAYAVAWPEGGADDHGEATWIAYQRPPLEGDPLDAPTHAFQAGRTVRFKARAEPFPLPKPGHKAILEDSDNSLVAIGGMDGRRFVWNPLVWHQAKKPIVDLWPQPADDLVQANHELDISLTWLQYVTNCQCHGQPVVTGSGDQIRAFGPQSLIRLDEGGTFSYVSPNANVTAALEVLQKLTQVQCMLRSLAPDSYSLQRPSIQTGPAKKLEQSKLIDARSRRITIADQWEYDRFEIERVLHNHHGVKTERPAIPDEVEQTVRWGELRVPVDRMEQTARLKAELDAQFISIVDAIMESQGVDRPTAESMARRAAPGVSIGDDAQDAPPADPDAEAAEKDQKLLETLVKAKVPDEATRGLLLRILDRAGLVDAEVAAAVKTAELRWYTEVQAELAADTTVDELEDE